jgi:hypothetical protein
MATRKAKAETRQGETRIPFGKTTKKRYCCVLRRGS